MKEFSDELNHPDVARQDVARAKLLVGGLTMGAISTLAWSGLVTGSAPVDPESKRTLRAIDWQPNSFNVSGLIRLSAGQDHRPRKGDQYIGFDRMEPAALIFGTVADITNMVAAMPWTDTSELPANAQQVIIGSVAAVAKQFSSRSWVQQMARMMEFASNPAKHGASTAGGMGGGFVPFSGAVRQAEQVISPEMTEARTAVERVLSSFPGFSKTVPMYRTFLDASPYIPGGIYGPMAMARLRDDPEAHSLAVYGANAPEVPNAISVSGGQKIALTPAQRDEWAIQRGTGTIAGKTARARIRETVEKFKPTDSPELRTYRLEEILRAYHDMGRERMQDTHAIVRESVRAAEREYAKSLQNADPDAEAAGMTPLIRSLGR